MHRHVQNGYDSAGYDEHRISSASNKYELFVFHVLKCES